MRIRIYNALILTMETLDNLSGAFTLKPYFKGEIHIQDDLISAIIPEGTITKKTGQSFDTEINAHGNLIMPGFKNAHSHSPMTFARSIADDMPLQEWLNTKIFPMEAKLSDDAIKTFTKIAILEYLSSGITASFDMYFRPENIIETALESGYRSVICGAVNDFVESVPRMEDFYKKYNEKDSLISYKLGFHAEYTTSKELLQDIAALAKGLKAPVYCHNSETKGEVAGCMARYGKTPIEFLDSLGMFEYGGGGFHLLYTTENDLDILKKRNIHVVTNPASNAKLASGIAPLYKYVDTGLNVAIGTDGASSNNALDMFREMYLTCVCQKLLTWNASAMDANYVLYMATVGGAKAMELNDCDILAPQKKADLIMIDLNQPNMQPLTNITKNIVYSGCRSNIIMTMINGKILYKDGEYFLNESPEEIYSKANILLKDLI